MGTPLSLSRIWVNIICVLVCFQVFSELKLFIVRPSIAWWHKLTYTVHFVHCIWVKQSQTTLYQEIVKQCNWSQITWTLALPCRNKNRPIMLLYYTCVSAIGLLQVYMKLHYLHKNGLVEQHINEFTTVHGKIQYVIIKQFISKPTHLSVFLLPWIL